MKLLVILFTFLFAAPLFAANDSVKVIAVVNDQIISSVDVNERIALVLATTGITDTEANRAKVIPQIIRQLIDEKLQMQEATKLSITIDDTKIHEAIAKIERTSGKPAGSLEEYLKSKNVSQTTFYNQLRAQLAWGEVVSKKIRPLVHVSDQEVARYTKRKSESDRKNTEVYIASIILPIDTPANEGSVGKFAEKLTSEIRGGAKFEAIATQFSANASHVKSIDPFWVELASLDPAIANVLVKTEKGAVTDPIKTESGYQIIKLFDSREKAPDPAEAAKPQTDFTFKVITLGTSKQETANQVSVVLAKKIAASNLSCDDKAPSLKMPPETPMKTVFIRNSSSKLPAEVVNLLNSMQIGSNSAPIVAPNGILIFKLCDKQTVSPASVPATPAKTPQETAKQSIYEEKMGLEMQKYMRNLRSDAFIEMRNL